MRAGRSGTLSRTYTACVPHLDLSRAPYVLYGVKYIDLVSLGAFPPDISFFLERTPPVSTIFPIFLPHSRVYEVVSLHVCSSMHVP